MSLLVDLIRSSTSMPENSSKKQNTEEEKEEIKAIPSSIANSVLHQMPSSSQGLPPLDEEAEAIFRTSEILLNLANKKIHPWTQLKRNAFDFRIHSVVHQQITESRTSPLVRVVVDCSKKKHQEDVEEILENIKSHSEYNSLFAIESCRVSEPIFIKKCIQEIQNEIAEDPRTPPPISDKIRMGQFSLRLEIEDMVLHQPKQRGPRWGLTLNFTGTFLEADQIQYLIWKIIHLKKYQTLFAIKKLSFSYNTIALEQLADSSKSNLFYPGVQGEEIGRSLQESLTELCLEHWKVCPKILPYLAQYQNLETLVINFSIQKMRESVVAEDLQAACPHLKRLEFQQPLYLNSN